MTAWHDDDDFWREFTPAIFTGAHFAQAAGEVEALIELAGPPPGARVLDLCCGPGRHAVELARQGYLVTGVDRNPGYLARARERAAAEGLTVELVEADMREFSRPGGFDLAINLYTSFSFFDDPAEERRVLENLAASLDQGGTLVMELMGKEVLARIFTPRDWQTLPGGTLWLQERILSTDWRSIDVRWLLIKPDGTRFERMVSHRLYAASELSALLLAVGLVDVECYGSLAGEPYDHLAPRMVVVARKPLV